MASSSRQEIEDEGVGRLIAKVEDTSEPEISEAAVSSTQKSSAPRDDISTDVTRETAAVSLIPKMKIFEERAKKMGEKFGLVIEASDLLPISPNETVLRVDKPIRMRVRHTCHRCNATFAAKSDCPKCRHVRCEKCPRYPARESDAGLGAKVKEKETLTKPDQESPPIMPDIYWGDRRIELKRPSRTGGQDLVHRRPRQRVRRTCHECRTLFGTGTRKCENCNHIRCTDCPRDPPKKDKYPFGYPGDAFGPDSDARFECNDCETLYPADAEDGTACTICGLEKSGESPRALPRKVQPPPDWEIVSRLQARLDGLREGQGPILT